MLCIPRRKRRRDFDLSIRIFSTSLICIICMKYHSIHESPPSCHRRLAKSSYAQHAVICGLTMHTSIGSTRAISEKLYIILVTRTFPQMLDIKRSHLVRIASCIELFVFLVVLKFQLKLHSRLDGRHCLQMRIHRLLNLLF